MGSKSDNKLQMERNKVPVFCSQRWNLATIGFLGFFFVYVVRVNLSVAIICMVKPPLPLNQSGTNYLQTNDGTTYSPAPNDSQRLLITTPSQETTEAERKPPLCPYLDQYGVVTKETSDIGYKASGSEATKEDVGGTAETRSNRDTTKTASLGDTQRGPGGQGEAISDGQVGEEDGTEDSDNTCGAGLEDGTTILTYTGEFDWDKVTSSRLLAMYFYGYIFTQVPGGWLAGRYGGRRVWGWCQLISALCTLFTPLAARTHVDIASALRFVLGLAAGVSFPCFHSMMGRWAPKLERSKLVAFAFAGPPIGTILTFTISALLCSYGFDNGWGSIFYLAGAGNLLWVVLWMYFIADTPSQDKRISEAERDYILDSIGERPDTKAKIAVPWRAMATSGPLWAIIFAHLCNNYTNYTLLTSLPSFMKEVLQFDIKQNGALSSAPYICMFIAILVVGQLADFLRAKKILTTKATRKLMQVISFLGMAACISAVGYMNCDQRGLAVFMLCLCLVFNAFNRPGYAVNHIDLAPRHAGVLFGITNTAGTIPGMIAPIVVGALTPNRTAEEWRNVFFICAGFLVLGALVYGFLADGELQSWAQPPAEEFYVSADEKSDGRCLSNLEQSGGNGEPGFESSHNETIEIPVQYTKMKEIK